MARTKIDRIGETHNGFKLIKWLDYDKYLMECLKCGRTRPGQYSRVIKSSIRCKTCNPTNIDLYLNDVRDLALGGCGLTEISNILKCNINTINNILLLLKKSGELNDYSSEVEYSFKEIAEVLGISEHQVRGSYNSALRKIRCALEPVIDDYSDGYIDAPEHTQTA